MEQDDNGCPQGALPLKDAMHKWLPAELLGAMRDAEEDYRRGARRVSWRGAGGKLPSEIDVHLSDITLHLVKVGAQEAVAAQFLSLLLAGRLVAWGRVGSPIAPHGRIPADAWASLRLAHVAEGRARGPGVELFGIHVAAAVAPAEPSPAAPSPPEPVMTAARSEVSSGIASERRLEKWLTEAMTAEPSNPVSKPEMRQRAGREPGLSVSGRGFERAWAGAVKASGAVAWASPGRRKSPR